MNKTSKVVVIASIIVLAAAVLITILLVTPKNDVKTDNCTQNGTIRPLYLKPC